MGLKWVVVGDGGQAKVFHMHNTGGELVEKKSFVNPVARMAEHELRTDRPGKVSAGHAGGAEEPSIKDEAAKKLSKEVAAFLREGAHGKLFDELAIVAAPHFLGALRKELDPFTSKLVVKEVSRDIIHHTNHQILDHLKTLLA